MDFTLLSSVFIAVTTLLALTTHVSAGISNGTGSYGTLINLKSELFKTYDSSNRPVKDMDTPVNVSIDISINQLIELNAAEQILFLSLWLRQQWVDEILTWNPLEYNNISSFEASIASIWKPDITIYNDVREEERDLSAYTATVTSEGLVSWRTPIILKSSCLMDINYFPYDTQRCPIKFGSWHFNGYQLDLRNMSEMGDMKSFVTNGEWRLAKVPVMRTVKYYSCCPEPYPDVTFYLIVCRKPLFYIFNLVLPCIVVLAMAAISFYLPVESGEKVSFGVTAVLALMVFLQLVSDLTPTQSEVVPVLSVYLVTVLVLLCISTITSIMVTNIHFRGERGQSVPYWMQKVFLGFVATVIGKKKTVKEALRGKEPEDHHHSWERGANVTAVKYQKKSKNGLNGHNTQDRSDLSLPEDDSNDHENLLKSTQLLKDILRTLQGGDEDGQKQKEDECSKTQWQLIAYVIDRLVFGTYVIVTVIATVLFFTLTPACHEDIDDLRLESVYSS
ncbi:neuronal acetylcholine receptor subunit alpha-9 isoform X1 [Lingula anatina]|uniref:Neuronal acetylcholine receptor subunit alpha-9 isoform X1 n=1 Tax=Lingula anatina TaxID=7574 RepID=A0A1S3H490_LINAN|nr:neuronal acetylcholine receptor subunit alpha-9 isoform X1 [Lingula anatina]|eukprot:XP_013380777.1 neuronal acetylcholine receptor subunit alpha-9 isoform X1 [Lingula anatina]